MTCRNALALLLSVLALPLATVSAQACSVGNPPAPTAAERIAGRTDIRAVRGTLGLQVIGSGGQGKPQRVQAYISTESGKGIEVAYLYDPIWVICEIYYLPQADAIGTFYLSRTRRDGRYELIDWTGAYVENGHRIDEEVEEPPTSMHRKTLPAPRPRGTR